MLKLNEKAIVIIMGFENRLSAYNMTIDELHAFAVSIGATTFVYGAIPYYRISDEQVTNAVERGAQKINTGRQLIPHWAEAGWEARHDANGEVVTEERTPVVETEANSQTFLACDGGRLRLHTEGTIAELNQWAKILGATTFVYGTAPHYRLTEQQFDRAIAMGLQIDDAIRAHQCWTARGWKMSWNAEGLAKEEQIGI